MSIPVQLDALTVPPFPDRPLKRNDVAQPGMTPVAVTEPGESPKPASLSQLAAITQTRLAGGTVPEAPPRELKPFGVKMLPQGSTPTPAETLARLEAAAAQPGRAAAQQAPEPAGTEEEDLRWPQPLPALAPPTGPDDPDDPDNPNDPNDPMVAASLPATATTPPEEALPLQIA